MTDPDPATPSAITPYFTVDDADKFITFIKGAFGARIFRESRYPNGTLQHARALINGDIIMMNQASDEYPANISQIHLYTDDVARTYKKALQLGAQSIMAPNLRPHGDQMAGISDPCGNIWWIATAK